VRIEKLKHNYNVEIKLVHFPLHPDTPSEGREMATFYKERGLDPEKMYNDMKLRMDAEGLEYGKRTHTYNSRLAQELGKWSETVEDGERLDQILYEAYFIDKKNIGNLEVLVDLVSQIGLPTSEARSALENRTFEEAIDADWAKSREYGVSGVPTYVAGGYGVVGAQPYEALENLMQEIGAEKHT